MSRNIGTALVIGATGGVGGAVAQALLARGWTVKGLNRNPDSAEKRNPIAGIQWVAGDAMSVGDVVPAAAGCDLVFHGANPPGYRNWKGLALPMLQSSIAAARSSGARLVFPGTVYNYGADAGALVAEDAPQNPATRKGKIRVEMEQTIEKSGVPTLIMRAGDFFGPHVGNSWLTQGLITPGKPIAKVTYPGPHEIGHDWAYLPDLAEVFARLIDRRDELGIFERFHFEGHWLEPGVEMAEAIKRAARRSDLKTSALPWWLLTLIAPFNETLREMMKMRYLWQHPLRLDGTKLARFLGEVPHTPLDAALTSTLKAAGCLT